MFTGIVEGLARVRSISKIKAKNKAADTKMSIYLGRLQKGLKIGDSISVNGACLTITKLHKGCADFEIVDETMKRTSMCSLKTGEKVNIERSLRLNGRLEGHIVLGHVDGTGEIQSIITFQTETRLSITVQDSKLLCAIVPKGSLAIDGISLTVVDIKGDTISVVLIPHTLAITTLGLKSKGDRVNLEIDVIGRYVVKNILKKW
ncbi:MAG TPA: riboflavin synthase [Candidatus Nitrosopolaris sp.]